MSFPFTSMGILGYMKKLTCSSFWSRPLWLWVTLLVPSICLTISMSFGFSPFTVTIAIGVLSTISLLVFVPKRKAPTLHHIPVKEDPDKCEYLKCDQEYLVDKDAHGQNEDFKQEEVAQSRNFQEKLQDDKKENANGFSLESEANLVLKCQEESLDFPSDCESEEEVMPSETFGVDFMCYGQKGQSQIACYSSGTDDEDGELIEISLPNGGHVCLDEENGSESKSDFCDDLAVPSFKEEEIKVIFADIDEMNEEEDSLIELDISVGSIKRECCEIEA